MTDLQQKYQTLQETIRHNKAMEDLSGKEVTVKQGELGIKQGELAVKQGELAVKQEESGYKAREVTVKESQLALNQLETKLHEIETQIEAAKVGSQISLNEAQKDKIKSEIEKIQSDVLKNQADIEFTKARTQNTLNANTLQEYEISERAFSTVYNKTKSVLDIIFAPVNAILEPIETASKVVKNVTGLIDAD